MLSINSIFYNDYLSSKINNQKLIYYKIKYVTSKMINDKSKINNIDYNFVIIILILILIIQIFTFFFKRKSLKNNLREDRRKDILKKIKQNKYIDINKDSININKVKIVNYVKIFIIKFLFINIIMQIKSNNIFFCYSNITLKIKESGKQDILGKNFQGMEYLKEVKINGNKNETLAKIYYFEQTDNFVELIFSDNINNCGYMFCGCNNITEFNFSNFNTSQVTSMQYMFKNCSSLISLDLSNFNTSKVESMENMFDSCSSLISLDLSNFDTSRIKNMDYMFYKCSSLISLNLSYFDTSQVTNMEKMFESCSSLISLDLSNFDTSQVTLMDQMFYNCTNLEYINLKKLVENSNLESYENIFDGVPINAVICINQILPNKLLKEIEKLICHNISCSDDWKLNQKKIKYENNINNIQCVDNCNKNSLFNFEYNGQCVQICSKGVLSDDKNKCKCILDKCLLCNNVALQKDLCTKCNYESGYYPKENDPENIGEYINCYNQIPEGYYVDNNYNLYKKCYHTCKTCNREGSNINHNCKECSDNFLFGIKIDDYYNCYKNCSYYYYFDNDKIFHCTKNLSCPCEYPKLDENKKECIKPDFNYEEINENTIKTINSLFHETNKNIETTINISNYNIIETYNSYEEEIIYYDNILHNIEINFTSIDYDTTNLDKGKDEIINNGKITTTLTTSQNQRNNIYNNMTRIDLGKCEFLLRKFYNISINESLYIKKIDIKQETMKTLKVEYDVYAKLFGKNLIKLNLTICEKTKISILIPIELTDNLDKYNSSSGYYNDICYTTTSEDGTDILLKDRQKEFIDKDKVICQENCDFSEYDYDTFVAKCSCEVKECSESFADMNINKTKLLENFINIKKIVNFTFLKCYKKLFNKLGILNNIGCYIILAIIIFHIISIFILSGIQFSSLKKKIKKIISLKENEKDKTYIMTKMNRLTTNKTYLSKNYRNKHTRKLKNSINKITPNSKIKINSKNLENIKYTKINLKNYIEEEINDFSYNLAIKYDKRNYCQYYISLLKTQHNLICALFNNNDYNSGIIKINLFLIGFSIEYIVNALFYNDDTMHKIYESKGEFDLETQLPIIVYSTIISTILNYPLNFLALTNDAIINFKHNGTKINIFKKAKRLIKTLTIKLALYYFVSFIFLSFFWYYISMFGVIYKNTQIHLLKDTLMSFELSLIIPFIIYLIPGLFRIPSISNANKKRICLYNFSKFLQLF